MKFITPVEITLGGKLSGGRSTLVTDPGSPERLAQKNQTSFARPENRSGGEDIAVELPLVS